MIGRSEPTTAKPHSVQSEAQISQCGVAHFQEGAARIVVSYTAAMHPVVDQFLRYDRNPVTFSHEPSPEFIIRRPHHRRVIKSHGQMGLPLDHCGRSHQPVLPNPIVEGIVERLIHHSFEHRQRCSRTTIPVNKGGVSAEHGHFVLSQKRELGFALVGRDPVVGVKVYEILAMRSFHRAVITGGSANVPIIGEEPYRGSATKRAHDVA